MNRIVRKSIFIFGALLILTFIVSCGNEIISSNDEIISSEEHICEFNLLEKQVAPTCGSEGYELYKCTCGETNKVILSKVNHNYGSWVMVEQPTLTKEGKFESVCFSDSTHKKEIVAPKLDDENYIIHSQESTCKEEGEATYIYNLSDNDYITFKINLEKKNHTYDDELIYHNDDQHYSYCNGCLEYFGYENHNLVDSICSVCNYSQDLNFIEVSDGYAVSGLKSENKNIIIPKTYKGKNVVEIIAYAFSSKEIESITIPSTVKIIGNEAFKDCKNLVEINLVDGIEIIEDRAFLGSGLKKITLPSTLKNIGDLAFAECVELSEIVFSEGLEEIGMKAFYNTSLINLKLPDNLVDIGKNAFAYIQELKSVKWSENLSIISESLFESCTSLETISSVGKVTIVNENAFRNCSSLVNIDDFVALEVIGERAFDSCSSIKSFNESNNLKEVGVLAFNNCIALTEVVLDGEIDGVADSTFKNCINIERVTFCDSIKVIEGQAFSGCQNIKVLNLNLVEKVEFGAFENCSGVEELHLGKGVKEIENYSYSLDDLINLKKIYLPSTLEYIGSGFRTSNVEAIYYDGTISDWCKVTMEEQYSLFSSYYGHFYTKDQEGNYELPSNLIVPKTVTKLSAYQFAPCKELIRVELHNDITSIGLHCFVGCDKLLEVNFLGYSEDWCKIKFEGNYSNPVQHSRTLKMYSKLGQLCVVDNINLENTVKEISSYAFAGLNSLVSIDINEGVTKIGAYAFYNCENLEKIYLPKSLTQIGEQNSDNVFGNSCFNLKSVYFDGTMEQWLSIKGLESGNNPLVYGADLYLNKDGLYVKVEKINVSGSIGSLGYQINSIGSVSEIFINEGITNLSDYSLAHIYNLEKLVLPKSLKLVGKNILVGSSLLDKIYYCGNEDEWNSITIDQDNTDLFEKQIYFYSEEEITDGYYWHYDLNNNIVIW